MTNPESPAQIGTRLRVIVGTDPCARLPVTSCRCAPFEISSVQASVLLML